MVPWSCGPVVPWSRSTVVYGPSRASPLPARPGFMHTGTDPGSAPVGSKRLLTATLYRIRLPDPIGFDFCTDAWIPIFITGWAMERREHLLCSGSCNSLQAGRRPSILGRSLHPGQIDRCGGRSYTTPLNGNRNTRSMRPCTSFCEPIG